MRIRYGKTFVIPLSVNELHLPSFYPLIDNTATSETNQAQPRFVLRHNQIAGNPLELSLPLSLRNF